MKRCITKLDTAKAYYRLAKPGIIYGNVLTAVAGFLLITRFRVDYQLLIQMLTGVALVIGSACIFNNYIDRFLDAKMVRTKHRALVVGSIPLKDALVYATVLGILGFGILIYFTNWLTVLVGLIGYIDYIVFYGLAKRRSNYGTVVGTISGATALVAGYVTAANQFDMTVVVLFLIMFFWQMAHFHAIALYRLKDYSAAGLPVLPAIRGEHVTRFRIQLYIAGFIISTACLAAVTKVSLVYLIVMFCAGSIWFWTSQHQAPNHTEWARRMFKLSLIVLLIFCLLLSLNVVLA